MFIGLIGPAYSGRRTIASYLIEHHGFTPVFFAQPSTPHETLQGRRRMTMDDDAESKDGMTTRAGDTVSKEKRDNRDTCRQDTSILHKEKPDKVDTMSTLDKKDTCIQDDMSTLTLNSTSIKSAHRLCFDDMTSLVHYVTSHFQQNFLLCLGPTRPGAFVEEDLTRMHALLKKCRKRPFFLLASVQAPLSLRYQRYLRKATEGSSTPCIKDQAVLSLEAFIQWDDAWLYGRRAPSMQGGKGANALWQAMGQADIAYMNDHADLSAFFNVVEQSRPLDRTRLRPGWDQYFLGIAYLAAKRSNCMKRRVGALLVSPKNRIVATGYNGTPQGRKNCFAGGCPRCNGNASRAGEGLETPSCVVAPRTNGKASDREARPAHLNAACYCLHAEENALLEAGRQGAEGSTLYCTTCPCLSCAKKICQLGVRSVVYCEDYDPGRGDLSGMDSLTHHLFAEAEIQVKQIQIKV